MKIFPIIFYGKVQWVVLALSHDPVVEMKFEFCAHSARLLRKFDHVLLWILSNRVTTYEGIYK